MTNGSDPAQSGTTAQQAGSTQQDSDGPGGSSPLSDPVPRYGTFLLGLYFFAVAAVTFYLLVATWPVAVDPPKKGFTDFQLFAWGPYQIASDLRLFITVICAGALGALIHSTTSFADYVGNRKLSLSWVWWLVLRVPIGVALALLFYVVLRGGLVSPTGGTSDGTQPLNPYGVAAISALAGLFSKQATDKLREVFDTLFRTRDAVSRADPLDHAIPVITGLDPAKLKVGATTLTLNIAGSMFRNDCTASINNSQRVVERVSDKALRLTILPDDIKAPGKLQLVIRNPGTTGGDSTPIDIPVED